MVYPFFFKKKKRSFNSIFIENVFTPFIYKNLFPNQILLFKKRFLFEKKYFSIFTILVKNTVLLENMRIYQIMGTCG